MDAATRDLLMSNTSVEFSGASMRALMDAMSALTFALTRQLTQEQQDGLATDLSRLAKDASNNGNVELEALLMDIRKPGPAAVPCGP
jgi:hypothetical protein